MSAPLNIITITLPEGCAPRLDKALAAAVPAELALSRSRLQALIGEGAVRWVDGAVLSDVKTKVRAGDQLQITVPVARETKVAAEVIALDIAYEDASLIVVNKPAGMVVHPAPGSRDGTLVNALLHHAGDTLSGIGGEKRPGIVHRIDKETSGLLVVAKSDAAHHGLARQFAKHTATRRYLAVLWGAPDVADPRLAGLAGVRFEPGGIIRIEGNIGRHKTDRKRMAVQKGAGRHAVTRVRVLERFGPMARPVASLVECQLETGRTHQIRVHLAHVGLSLVGDPTYGRQRALPKAALSAEALKALKEFQRQALHAAHLGFVHPISGEVMEFSAELPMDFNLLLTQLRQAGKKRI